jgi:hypothetical protein
MHRSCATSWDTIKLKSQTFQVERPDLPFLRNEERVTKSSRLNHSHPGTTAATCADPRCPSHIVECTWPTSLDEKT